MLTERPAVLAVVVFIELMFALAADGAIPVFPDMRAVDPAGPAMSVCPVMAAFYTACAADTVFIGRVITVLIAEPAFSVFPLMRTGQPANKAAAVIVSVSAYFTAFSTLTVPIAPVMEIALTAADRTRTVDYTRMVTNFAAVLAVCVTVRLCPYFMLTGKTAVLAHAVLPVVIADKAADLADAVLPAVLAVGPASVATSVGPVMLFFPAVYTVAGIVVKFMLARSVADIAGIGLLVPGVSFCITVEGFA